MNEIEVLKILNHPNIIKLHEVFEGEKHVYFVMEYVKGGELLAYLRERINYSEDTARKIMKSVLEALSYCHSLNIVHRDLKPENLILT